MPDSTQRRETRLTKLPPTAQQSAASRSILPSVGVTDNTSRSQSAPRLDPEVTVELEKSIYATTIPIKSLTEIESLAPEKERRGLKGRLRSLLPGR
jgi:hypothetical protein